MSGVRGREAGSRKRAAGSGMKADTAARETIADALDDTLVVEAAAGTGKTTELVGAYRPHPRARTRARRQHCRRHVHREGCGRAEAAAARRARRRARAGGGCRARGAERRAALARGGARQHDPRLLRGAVARASRRGAGGSAVHRADGTAGRAAVRPRVRRLDAGAARGSVRRRPAGAAPLDLAGVRRRLARGHTDRSSAPRSLGSCGVARLRRAVDAARARPHGGDRRARVGAADVRVDDRGPVVCEGHAVHRHPRRTRPRDRDRDSTGGRRSARLRRLGSPARGSLARPRFFAGAPRTRSGLQGRRPPAHARRRVRRAARRPRSVPPGRRRGSRRAAAGRAGRRDCRVRSAQDADGRARLSRPPPEGARSGSRQRGRSRRVPAPVHAHLRRRVSGYRPAAGRDPPPARRVGSRRHRLADGHARAGPPVHRRRSEAVDLPVPARGRRDLPSSVRAARQRRREAGDVDDELSQRAGDPGVPERGVRAGHGRRRGDAAGRLRAVDAPSRSARGSAGCRRAARARAVRRRATSRP